MKRECIYKNEEIEIFADENRTIWEYEIPYMNQYGEWVDNNSIVPIHIDTNSIAPDMESEVFLQICPETIAKIQGEEFRGKVLSPCESFFQQIKFQYGMEAAEALCSYFLEELEQAEKRFQETR